MLTYKISRLWKQWWWKILSPITKIRKAHNRGGGGVGIELANWSLNFDTRLLLRSIFKSVRIEDFFVVWSGLDLLSLAVCCVVYFIVQTPSINPTNPWQVAKLSESRYFDILSGSKLVISNFSSQPQSFGIWQQCEIHHGHCDRTSTSNRSQIIAFQFKIGKVSNNSNNVMVKVPVQLVPVPVNPTLLHTQMIQPCLYSLHLRNNRLYLTDIRLYLQKKL